MWTVTFVAWAVEPLATGPPKARAAVTIAAPIKVRMAFFPPYLHCELIQYKQIRPAMRACLISLKPRSPVAVVPVMTPMAMPVVPVVPVVPVAPAHLGGLRRIVLDRGGSAWTGQRHRLRALRWSSQDQQCAYRGKANNSRNVHSCSPLG